MKRLNAPKHWMLDKLGGAFVSTLMNSFYIWFFSFFLPSSRLITCYFNSSSTQAPKPSSGPHKSRECLPLILILRNRLKYALTYREVQSILMQRHVLVDNKVRTDKTYPAGFMGKYTKCPYYPPVASPIHRSHPLFSHQMLSQSPKPMKTSVFYMTPRVDSDSTQWEMRKPRLVHINIWLFSYFF